MIVIKTFVVVSDIHLTQVPSEIRKIRNFSERSLVLVENFTKIVKENIQDEIYLIVVGDWLDNINKITIFDLKISNLIFSKFKNVFLINGNHDIYSMKRSDVSYEISTVEIFERNKNVIGIKQNSVVKVNSNLYFWFLPYSIENNVMNFITEKFKQFFQQNNYNNDSYHYFFSHVPIMEIESYLFHNTNVGLNYTELRKYFISNKIKYKFFQGHYHMKNTERIIDDPNFHIITTFPKNFQDKITKVSEIENSFGFYEINVTETTVKYEFKQMNKYYLFCELNETESIKLIDFLSNEENFNKYMVYLRVNMIDNSVIEKLRKYVQRLYIITDIKKLKNSIDNVVPEQIEDEKNNELLTPFQYLQYYISNINSINNETKAKILEILNEIKLKI